MNLWPFNCLYPLRDPDRPYYFNVPKDAKEVKVTAKLHYRSFGQHLADLLLGNGAIKVPSVEMVSVEKTYPVTELKTASATSAEKHH